MSAQPHPEHKQLAARYEIALALVVLAAALALRLTGLNVFVTPDEHHWYDRSRAFHNALQSGDLAETFQSVHPGVVTMWVGAASIRSLGLDDPGPYDDFFKVRQQAAERTGKPQTLGLPPVLVRSRAILAIVTWLCLGASYLLMRKLFDRFTALIALALLALDPFFLAHSRLHHLDALLASFMTVSILGLVLYLQNGKWRYLILSGVAGGLAISNKSPGAFLAPRTALVLGLDLLLLPAAARRQALGRSVVALMA